MDTLKAEIAKKRQLLQAAASKGNASAPGTEGNDSQPALKYMKRSVLDEVARQRSAKPQPSSDGSTTSAIANAAGVSDRPTKESSVAAAVSAANSDPELSDSDEKYENIPEEEFRRRFRALGEPVRLFGETHKQRVRRLKAMEMNVDQTDGQRNVFMSHVSQVNTELQMQDLLKNGSQSATQSNDASSSATAGSAGVASKKQQVFDKYEKEFCQISMKLAQQDQNRCSELIYVFLKRLLHEWGEQLDGRPDEVKRSAKGKAETITHRQTLDYMKPLFRTLKAKTVELDVLAHIAHICELAYHREYIKANEAYLRLSIGNAPWPIGVTGVNIHERTAHDRIKSNTVAHVLNDETQRKWVQSIKRLLTFSQQKYPPEDLSKLMG